MPQKCGMGVNMSFSYFIQQLLNGLSLGGAYALIAIGYTMVYGILRMINFAHGDEFMMAGYFMIYSIAVLQWFIRWGYSQRWFSVS